MSLPGMLHAEGAIHLCNAEMPGNDMTMIYAGCQCLTVM